MSDINDLYKAPKANLEKETTAEAILELAPRGKRLLAVIIDGLISTLITIPMFMYLGVWEMVKQGRQLPFTILLISGVVGVVLFLLLHGYLLQNYGQTIGKKLLNIYIVDLNNKVPKFGRLVSRRYLPLWLVSFVPIINSILPAIDALFIFRQDRRCIHDFLAGTKVIAKSR